MGEISIGTLAVHLRGVDDSFSKMLANAQKQATAAAAQLQRMGASLESAGARLTTSLTLPLAGIGAASIKAFASFDDAMTKSMAAFGTSSEGMRAQLEATAKTIASQSVTSADDLAKTLGVLAGSGLTAGQAMSGLASIEKFSVATGVDASRAAKLLADAQGVLGLRSDDAAQNTANLVKIQDELVKTSTLSGSSVEELGEALEHHGGAALRRFNVPLEHGLALLTQLSHQGVRGARAGAALAEQLGASGGASGATPNLDAAIGAAGGVTAQRAAANLQSFNAQLKILWNQADVAGQEIGASLVPSVRVLEGALAKGLDTWRSLDQSQRSAAVSLGLFVAGVGPALKVTGMLVGSFTAANAAILLVPASLAMVGDALGVTNTGVLDLVNSFRVGGMKIGTYFEDAAAKILAFGAEAKRVWAILRGDVAGERAAAQEAAGYRAQVAENDKRDAQEAAKEKVKVAKDGVKTATSASDKAAQAEADAQQKVQEAVRETARVRQATTFASYSLRRFNLNALSTGMSLAGGSAGPAPGQPTADDAAAYAAAQARAAAASAGRPAGTMNLGGSGLRPLSNLRNQVRRDQEVMSYMVPNVSQAAVGLAKGGGPDAWQEGMLKAVEQVARNTARSSLPRSAEHR